MKRKTKTAYCITFKTLDSVLNIELDLIKSNLDMGWLVFMKINQGNIRNGFSLPSNRNWYSDLFILVSLDGGEVLKVLLFL